jgi:hypothetical protein
MFKNELSEKKIILSNFEEGVVGEIQGPVAGKELVKKPTPETEEVNKLLLELNSESKSIIGNMENLLRLTNGDLPIPFIYNISKEAQLQINKWKQNILTIREILNKNYKLRGGYKNNINMLKLSITNKIKLIQPKY